jgi:hypothetical protein
MRYFMAIIPPADLKPDDVPQGLMDAMGPWMDRSLKSGALISTGGLKPAEEGKRLSGASGKVATTDGPFAEAKEVVGGYWLILAGSLDEAAAIAAQNPCLDYGLALEIRPIDPVRASAFALTNETPT